MHQTDEYSFAKFSSLPFYKQINERLLDIADVGKKNRIIDLGCGNGGVTKLILKRLQTAKESVIYAVDHSASALIEAVTELGDCTDSLVKFVQSEVQNLTSAINVDVDMVVYCNSIHYVDDKIDLLRKIRKRLKPGGVLAINTSFFDGSHPQETEDFYRRWMMRSLRSKCSTRPGTRTSGSPRSICGSNARRTSWPAALSTWSRTCGRPQWRRWASWQRRATSVPSLQ